LNTLKHTPDEPPVPEAPQEENRHAMAARKIFSSLNIFSIMEKERIIKMMPFVFFLTMLGLIYIANSYYAEKTIREIDATTKEIKELRSEFISVQSDLMIKSKQTEVLNAVSPMGLQQSLEPPKKIVVPAKTVKED
jgi:hypothetical protein